MKSLTKKFKRSSLNAVSISSRGRVTIPKTMRSKLGIDGGDLIRFAVDEEGVCIVGFTKPDGTYFTLTSPRDTNEKAAERP